MRFIFSFLVLGLAGCSTPVSIDPSALRPPKAWVFIPHATIEKPKAGDELFALHDQCRVSHNTLRVKHGIFSRWVKNATKG